MQTLADIGEVGFLRRLQRALPHTRAGVQLGIGDDAALLKGLTPLSVLSCDMLIEGVDFERAWASPKDIGHKAAAANLSDLAAMGAEPRGLLAAVALRPNERVADVLAMLKALDAMGRRYGAPLIGGDISKTSGPCVVSVTAIGRVGQEALRRGAARAGDVVMVSGTLGDAALGLRLLQDNVRDKPSAFAGRSAQRVRAARKASSGEALASAPVPRKLALRQLRPTPRVALGRVLARRKLARAAADISDGLAKDALHLVQNGLGVSLNLAQLPLSRLLVREARRLGVDPASLALTGGEDFELVLATAPSKVARAQAAALALGDRLTPVGSVVRKPGMHLVGAGEASLPRLSGFDHFG